ncbi:TRAP-type C4-dicarboxylate transport system, small permease component [Desulfuromusa kysingii]|uniref:TRAP-type C4-dicarboxylate transport system, small permease component n=1 Tax=Desulfuromusa kysingii TaxID=37625 RepID=A0A1H4E7A6_9BACT|nr:TRAP transporter small permease [Desulfuromusa kysingii]SEA80707.1 TRAP-type C4-dicarboxylate transport system, small permease component [Desulfuromusa kysingii]
MLKKIFKSIDRGFLFVEDWSLFIAVAVALLTAMANVILRKTTSNISLYWSDEVVRKVIYFSTYIGCVAAIRSRALIRIDALPQIFPVLKKPLTLISHVAVLFFALIMIYLGAQMTVMMFQDEYAKTATLQIPEWYFYAVLPIMGAMMFIRTLLVIVEDWGNQHDATGEN